MRRLLCICGKRYSGKDTFAALLLNLARARGIAVANYAFAAESKRLFVNREQSRGIKIELARLSSDRAYKEQWRPLLTQFTVEALAADPQIFVREVTRRVEQDTRPAVITDLRLQLELDWLRPRFDLLIVRMTRSDARRESSGWRFDAAKDLHPTETELDAPALWDLQVPNEGTLAELEEQAAQVLAAYLRGCGAPRSGH